MNDIKCVTECSGKCGNWDEIDDPDVIKWTCSDCCVMIGINKVYRTKRLFHYMITINNKTWISRDNYFLKKKEAQSYINQNKEKLEKERA